MLAVLSTLVLAFSAASAIPFSSTMPEITYPTNNVVWYKGEHRHAEVTWDASNLPQELVNNPIGIPIKLWATPAISMDLVTDFNFSDGKVVFPLPDDLFECTSCRVSFGDDFQHASAPFQLWDQTFIPATTPCIPA